MKNKILHLFALLFFITSNAQLDVTVAKKLKITQNIQDEAASKVLVQSSTGLTNWRNFPTTPSYAETLAVGNRTVVGIGTTGVFNLASLTQQYVCTADTDFSFSGVVTFPDGGVIMILPQDKIVRIAATSTNKIVSNGTLIASGFVTLPIHSNAILRKIFPSPNTWTLTFEQSNPTGGGGGSQNLQQVSDVGATTTNQITVQNVKIGSNALANTIVGQITTLPTGTSTTAIGFNAGSAASGFGGTYIGAAAGSLNAFNKNICLSANSNASTASSDNQFVINTNNKNLRFDTDIPLNILFQFPTTGGRFPISVNGNFADTAGNITVSTGSGTVTEVTGVSGETTVASGTTTPVIGISSTYTAARDSYADAKVQNSMSSSTTIAPSATAVAGEYNVVSGLTFSGAVDLSKKGGSYYNDLTQSGAITFSVSANTIGGIAQVKITANGSAITPVGSWINVGSDSISTTSGAVNRIVIWQTNGEVWYSVKVN